MAAGTDQRRGWIDCSQPLSASTPTPAGVSAVGLTAVRSYNRNGMSMQQLCVLTHHGTHVDAPVHFIPGGSSIDQLPLSLLSGPTTVIEIRRERLSVIRGDDLARLHVPRGHMLFLKTGWGARYTHPEYWEAPFLDASAASYLVERGVRALGVDLISPDEPAHPGRQEGFSYPVHHLLLGAGVPIVENLNLEAIAGGTYEAVAFPLRIEGGDGGPCRVAVRPIAWSRLG